MEIIYLTRRNLLTLLAKLDKVKQGEASHRCIVKQDIAHKTFPCTNPTMIFALEDDEYYTDREPGEVDESLVYVGQYRQKGT